MKRIVVNGGAPLQGEIKVGGSKNAALPIIFSCILMHGVSRIDNLPDIGDVRVALDILRGFGARVDRLGSTTYIDTTDLRYTDPDKNLVGQIRASTYLIGSCLSRFGLCPLMSFGGCNFSARPIDMHIDACLRLGARLDGSLLAAHSLFGNEITFAIPSVGATVNAILRAASAQEDRVIHGCAIEPHIDALIDFINSAGGCITRVGRDIFLQGRTLHGGNSCIIGDMIEAGSYLALGLLCGSDIRVLNSPVKDMDAVTDALCDMGAVIYESGLSARIENGSYLSLCTSPYPGFPTDLQPIMAALMAAYCGGDITDTVWPGRFGYLNSLADLGVEYTIDSSCARIFKSNLHCGITSATDLRGGMAALITSLASSGRSEIYYAEKILRGYGDLEEKLLSVGADIKIEEK